jgi:hypothetical protein
MSKIFTFTKIAIGLGLSNNVWHLLAFYLNCIVSKYLGIFFPNFLCRFIIYPSMKSSSDNIKCRFRTKGIKAGASGVK